jgi:hypothetical protein
MNDSRLPFSSYDETTGAMQKAWAVEDNGTWDEDVERGKNYADDLANIARVDDNDALTVRVIRGATKKRDGVSTGFMFRLAERLRYSAPMLLAMISVGFHL